VNGEPDVFATSDGRLISVIAFDRRGAPITRIHGVANPKKLGTSPRCWVGASDPGRRRSPHDPFDQRHSDVRGIGQPEPGGVADSDIFPV